MNLFPIDIYLQFDQSVMEFNLLTTVNKKHNHSGNTEKSINACIHYHMNLNYCYSSIAFFHNKYKIHFIIPGIHILNLIPLLVSDLYLCKAMTESKLRSGKSYWLDLSCQMLYPILRYNKLLKR